MSNHCCSSHHHDDEDLTGITDINERRKIQNRRSQRKRRANMRTHEKTTSTVTPMEAASTTSISAPASKTTTGSPTSWHEESVGAVDQRLAGIDNLFHVIHGHGLSMSLEGLNPFLDSRKPGIWAQAGNLSQQQHFMTDSWPEMVFETSAPSDIPILDSSISTIHGSVSPNEFPFASEPPVYNLDEQDLQPTEKASKIDRHDTTTRQDTDVMVGLQRQPRRIHERSVHNSTNHHESRNKTADSFRILGKIQKLVDAIIDIYTLGLKTDMIHQDDELLALIRSIPRRIHVRSDMSSDDDADIHAGPSNPAEAVGFYNEAAFAES